MQGKSQTALVDVWDTKTRGLEIKFKYLCEWILIYYVIFLLLIPENVVHVTNRESYIPSHSWELQDNRPWSPDRIEN